MAQQKSCILYCSCKDELETLDHMTITCLGKKCLRNTILHADCTGMSALQAFQVKSHYCSACHDKYRPAVRIEVSSRN